jgi:hypothetical protein
MAQVAAIDPQHRRVIDEFYTSLTTIQQHRDHRLDLTTLRTGPPKARGASYRLANPHSRLHRLCWQKGSAGRCAISQTP